MMLSAHLLHSVQGPDVIQGIQGGGQAAMQAEDLQGEAGRQTSNMLD